MSEFFFDQKFFIEKKLLLMPLNSGTFRPVKKNRERVLSSGG